MADSSNPSLVWERLRSRFGRRRADGDGRPRRGVAIAVCMVVSFLLWFTLAMREQTTVTLRVPTRVENLPEDVALRELPPPYVRVQVQGEGYQLLQLRFNTPSLPIDAAQSRIDPQDVLQALPKNVRVLGISPQAFDLQKEPRITRRVPIRLRYDVGVPPTHDFVSEPVLVPDSVDVSGARSIVNALTAWPTEWFRRDEVTDSLRVRVALSDTLAGLVALSRPFTTLVLNVQEFTEGLREIDVEVLNQPTDDRLVTLDPASVRVRYRVLLSQYEEAQTARDFFATVSFDEVRSDTTGQVRPRLHLPAGIVLRDVEMRPPFLQYYINVAD